MSGLSVEEGARAEQEAPLRGRRALPAVRAGRAQAGPRARWPPLPRSVSAPPPPTPFWAARFALAINTQEMHDLTCEVEPFPLCGHRASGLAEASGARRRGRRRAGRRGRSASQRQALFTAPLQSPACRQGEERRSSCPHSLVDDLGQPQCHLGIPTSLSPLLTSASGSDTFKKGSPRPGEKTVRGPNRVGGTRLCAKEA